MEQTQATELIRQQTRIADALERIANAMALACAMPHVATRCLHPENSRVDFGITNGHADWQCGLCKFRTVNDDGTPAEDR